MGCKDPVLAKSQLKNCTINCLKYEEFKIQPYNVNLCLFRALAIPFYGNQRLEEETSEYFNLFIRETDGLNTNQFQSVNMNKFPDDEDLLTLENPLDGTDVLDGNNIGEDPRRSVQKYKNTLRLPRHNNHLCYTSNINAVF